ncbi:hypothetical protein Goshw_011010, partial [Gossypium schwendimanii]|nr:hypothetical protein [Gossypium schwendimanii]
WNHRSSYVGLPEVLEEIRLLLDQRSKIEVKAINSAATARLEGTIQGGHAGKDNIDWSVQCEEHIQSWDCHEQFFSTETAAVDDYLAWFRAVGKSYLLSLEERSRCIFRSTHVLRMLHPCTDFDVEPCVETVLDVPTVTDTSAHVVVDVDVDAQYLSDQSTTEEDDNGVDPDDTNSQGVVLAMYSGDDDNEEEVYKPAALDTPPVAPSVVRPVARRNSPRDRHPPPSGTHSPRRHH